MSFLDRALPLLERGFSLIPLQPNGKDPCGIGTKGKSRDRAVIESWAAQNPNGNVGVCSDETTVILDADDAAALERRIGQINTYTVQSSPGKAHYYFRRDGFAVRNLELGTLGSLRADNLYVVSEGSLHPKTGEPYRVINDAPVATLSAGLYRELEELAGNAAREVERVVVNWDGKSKIPEGMRQYFLRTRVGSLWDGRKSEEELFAELSGLNQQFCEPPKTDAKVRELVRWIIQKEPNNPGPTVVVGKPSPPDISDSQLRLVPYTEIKTEQLNWLWEKFLLRGHLNMFSGDPGEGKSMIAVDLAARGSVGKAWPDGQSGGTPFGSIILSLEEGKGDTVKPRFLAAGGNPHFLFDIHSHGTIKLESALPQLRGLLKSNPNIRLLIFDPLLDFIKAGINDEQQVRDILTSLKRMAQELDIAIIGLNHLNKKSDLAAIHRTMGAKGFVGVARSNFVVGRDETNQRHLAGLKNNLCRLEGSLKFEIHSAKPVYGDDGMTLTNIGAINWLGAGDAYADDLNGQKKLGSPVADWLKGVMMQGTWYPAAELYDSGVSEGYSRDQVKRALGVIKAENRRTRTVPAKTEWCRPITIEAVSAEEAQSAQP
jgi:hypothetical protein